MKIQKNYPLSKLTTIKLGGRASFVVTVRSPDDVPRALKFAEEKKLPWFVLSGGSNSIGSDAFNGVVILMRIGGIKRLEGSRWRFGAGVVLDTAVEKTVKAGLSGMECLSGIPGNVGGAPVHNAGAYGQELSDVMTSVEAYSVKEQKFVTLGRKDCKFEYLGSMFKHQPKEYIITEVNVELHAPDSEMPIKHEGLKKHLAEHGVNKVSPKLLRRAVLTLRAERLPSVKKYASAGSFFKNPLLSAREFVKFHKNFPEAPYDEQPDRTVKVYAGWLMDKAGLKGVEKYGFVSYDKNALIVINKSALTFTALEQYTDFVQKSIRKTFGIKLERDPDVIS